MAVATATATAVAAETTMATAVAAETTMATAATTIAADSLNGELNSSLFYFIVFRIISYIS